MGTRRQGPVGHSAETSDGLQSESEHDAEQAFIRE